MVIISAVVYVSLYLQTARDVRAAEAGLYLLPMAVGMTVSGIASGRVVKKPGRFRKVMVSGMTMVTVSMALLSLLRVDTSAWLLNGSLLLLGAGLGQVLGLALVAVQLTAPEKQMGVAITSVRFSQMLGGAIGTAILGTVLARSYASHLPDALKNAQGDEPSAARIQELPADVQPQVVDALVAATNTVFLVGAHAGHHVFLPARAHAQRADPGGRPRPDHLNRRNGEVAPSRAAPGPHEPSVARRSGRGGAGLTGRSPAVLVPLSERPQRPLSPDVYARCPRVRGPSGGCSPRTTRSHRRSTQSSAGCGGTRPARSDRRWRPRTPYSAGFPAGLLQSAVLYLRDEVRRQDGAARRAILSGHDVRVLYGSMMSRPRAPLSSPTRATRSTRVVPAWITVAPASRIARTLAGAASRGSTSTAARAWS